MPTDREPERGRPTAPAAGDHRPPADLSTHRLVATTRRLLRRRPELAAFVLAYLDAQEALAPPAVARACQPDPLASPPLGAAPAAPTAETDPAPPFEGETIADVVARSGSVAVRPYEWLELAAQALWEESPARRSFAQLDDAVAELLRGAAPLPVDVACAIDDCEAARQAACTDVVARVAYVLGRDAHLPEPERVARAKALASLVPGLRRYGQQRAAAVVAAARAAEQANSPGRRS